jgi:exopolysaccharide biosynthesis protein
MKNIKKLIIWISAAILLAHLAGCAEIDEMVQTVIPAPTPSLRQTITLEAAEPSPVPFGISSEATPVKPAPLKVTTGEGEWSASCDAFSVQIVEKYIGESRSYVADVKINDMAALRSAYAYDTFESKRKEPPSEIAKRHEAVFAVNGDYYSYRSDGVIVRNRQLDRNRPVRDMLAIFDDGHMEVLNEQKSSTDELFDQGLMHTFSFGPQLVKDGVAIQDFSSSNIKNSNPRTGVGMIEPGHFLFIVVDGRQEDTHGMTLARFAEVFEEYGCELAYNFDGGASSTMIFMGEHINVPSGNLAVAAGRERVVSDILYLAEP